MSPLALQSWSSASKKSVRAAMDIRVASITCIKVDDIEYQYFDDLMTMK